MHAVLGADFHDAAMVVGVGVGKHSLWMSLVEHRFQVGVPETLIEAVLIRIAVKQSAVRLGDSDDLNVLAIFGLSEKSFGMAVH